MNGNVSPKLSQYGTNSIHWMDYLPTKENNHSERKLSACISIKILIHARLHRYFVFINNVLFKYDNMFLVTHVNLQCNWKQIWNSHPFVLGCFKQKFLKYA